MDQALIASHTSSVGSSVPGPVGINYFTCVECGSYSNRWKSRVRTHFMRCGRPYVCSCRVCGERFVTKGRLKRHLSEACPGPLLGMTGPSDMYDGPSLVIDEKPFDRPLLPSLGPCISPGRLDCAFVYQSGRGSYCCTKCEASFRHYSTALCHLRSHC